MDATRMLTRLARALVALGVLTLVGVLIYWWLWPKTILEDGIPVGYRFVDSLVSTLGLTCSAWCFVAGAAARVIRDSMTWQRTLVGLAQVVGLGVVASGPLSSEVGAPDDSRPWLVMGGGLLVIIVAKVVGYVTLGPKHAFVPVEQGNAMGDPAIAFAPAPASPEDPAPGSYEPRRF